jgi:hypothetical protein
MSGHLHGEAFMDARTNEISDSRSVEIMRDARRNDFHDPLTSLRLSDLDLFGKADLFTRSSPGLSEITNRSAIFVKKNMIGHDPLIMKQSIGLSTLFFEESFQLVGERKFPRLFVFGCPCL